MTPERWQKVCDIFDAALEQPDPSLEEFLRDACGGDTELYSVLHDMLEQHRRKGFLDDKPLGPADPAPVTPPVFRDGQTVAGRYRIVRFVNRGGMGEVYEAQDLGLELGETVALKTLLPDIAGDASMIARFKQEIALSRKVAHVNVCKVYDLNEHECEDKRRIIFLTMEFLGGETLAAKLHRDGAMSTAAALPILEQMGAALDASHQAGVIHRDLKPSNVMLAPSEHAVRAVVTDFGLARSFIGGGGTTSTMSTKVIGTLDYMAPELLTGSTATFGSDVYALGMVAYLMVTGALPFGAGTPLAGAILRAKQPVPSPRVLAPGLDEKWERAILRALDRNPANRFTKARHFLEALRGETVSMTVKLPVMTRRRAVAAGLAAALAVAAGVGWREWVAASHRLSPEAQSLYQKGVDDIAAGAYFAATKALGETAKLAPLAAQVRARLAEAWVELEMPEKANKEMLLAMHQDNSDLSKLDRLEIEATYLTVTRDFAAATKKREQIISATTGGETAGLHVDLGRAYEKSGQPDKALAAYRLAANGPVHNPAAWLRIGILAGRSWKNVQSLSQSEEAFRQAEEIYQQTSNLEGLTEVAFQRGIAANRRGQLDQGAAYLRKAMETARLAGNIQKEVSAKLQLATNAYQSGNATFAEQYAKEALDTARANQIESLAISGLVTLGNSYRVKGESEGSEKYLLEALTLARGSGSNRLVALSLFSLAALHNDTRHAEQSAREASEALAFFQPNHWVLETFQCLTLLGRANRDKGDYKGALDSFHSLLEAAEKAQDKSQMAGAHESLGQVLYKQELYPDALNHYRKSLELSVEPGLIGYAALHCANALWQLGRYDDARAMFDKAEGLAQRFAALQLAVSTGRAAMALSERRYDVAAGALGRILASDKSHDSSTIAALKASLGLALIGTGNGSGGLRNCEEGVAAAMKSDDVADLFDARATLLEALLETGSRVRALSLFHEMEPSLLAHPAWHWRLLALVSGVDHESNGRARDALSELATLWGDEAFQNYLSRPDVRPLARPLLPVFSAKRQ